ncbi:MAG: hypothetical protein D6714_17365 [Bacteroidetes bacterium]|nr:MAG: hypothetical protein D6714_17365 [Bacteroidota bacterium]
MCVGRGISGGVSSSRSVKKIEKSKMEFKKRILYSVIPTIAVVVLILQFSTVNWNLSFWHVIGLNLLLVLQTVLLYKEMGRYEIHRERKILYVAILMMFLPFHYILVWLLLKKDTA